MGKETKQDTLQQIVDELASVGARGGQDVTKDKVADLMAKALKGMNGSDKDTLMALLSLALLQNRRPEVTEIRPQALECDVVRFQNNKEKWVALVGLLDGYPYEIFTGLQDDDEGIMLPKTVTKGKIIKQVNPDGSKRYDFQFENKRGYKTTVEGLSEKFNPEYWNYAKLISGVLKDESINTWKVGVERALKKYIPGGHDDNESEE